MANKKYMTMQVVVPGIHEVVEGLGVNETGAVQQFVTQRIFDKLKPYLPFKIGKLRDSARIYNPTIIRVDTVYARAQFFGVTSKGAPFKYEPTGPKVGSHWDRRLKADEGAEIVAEANRLVKGMRLR